MQFDFSSELDILTVEEQDYSSYSEIKEFANFVVDSSSEEEILGVEVIDASEATPLNKKDLENISDMEWKVMRTDEFLEISLVIIIGDTKNVISSNLPVNSGVKT